ncbi:MAG TPA: glycoside hydrolase family 15 protein, partial [Polyangiaceae bacterium]|nr:glycoside hydrolase family 15 protein [Polyangiaceae bacterium]
MSAPRWTDANKTTLVTGLSEVSRVWLSTSRGVLTEVFYPSPDQACVRRMGFVVTDEAGFVSEEASGTVHEATALSDGVPVSILVNTCAEGRYRIEKSTVPDPQGDVVVQRVRFQATRGDASAYRLYCVLEPHLDERGEATTAFVAPYKGRSMLFATSGDGVSLALACSAPWLAASADPAGASNGRAPRELGVLTTDRRRAGPGHVILTAEVDHRANGGEVTLALAFARRPEEAAQLAVGSLLRGHDAALAEHTRGWRRWSAALASVHGGERPRLWDGSTAALKTLESKGAVGGRVAALSTPWGASKGPGIDGTYHVVWTRDLVESVSGLLAAGGEDEARRALVYLRCTQEKDGHWPQNMRMDGRAFWKKEELDETALPLLFLHLVHREGLLTADELHAYWPMVESAAGFIARTGPSSKRDRWEDTEGVSPFTLAASIGALLVAADVAELA